MNGKIVGDGTGSVLVSMKIDDATVIFRAKDAFKKWCTIEAKSSQVYINKELLFVGKSKLYSFAKEDVDVLSPVTDTSFIIVNTRKNDSPIYIVLPKKQEDDIFEVEFKEVIDHGNVVWNIVIDGVVQSVYLPKVHKIIYVNSRNPIYAYTLMGGKIVYESVDNDTEYNGIPLECHKIVYDHNSNNKT